MHWKTRNTWFLSCLDCSNGGRRQVDRQVCGAAAVGQTDIPGTRRQGAQHGYQMQQEGPQICRSGNSAEDTQDGFVSCVHLSGISSVIILPLLPVYCF